MGIKVVGHLSKATGKVYSKKSTAKGVDTKAAKAEYNAKLEKLKEKYNQKI